MRRTKIVATAGPASRDPETLEKLMGAGVDVFRLNFSHGDHEQHAAIVASVRRIAQTAERSVAILQDLSGPKIRTGALEDPTGVELVEGSTLVITTDESFEGTSEKISTTYEPLPQDVKRGDTILLDDGNLELRVVSTKRNEVTTEVVHGGVLLPQKGMNLPGVRLSTPALTEKDRRDLLFGIDQKVDYVALSFVRRAIDIEKTREIVKGKGASIPIIAKIEKPEAVDELRAILEASDGVMVARGDLGVELSTEQVPTLQKRIIAEANGAGKMVITATQMLESMIDHARPTRAEASDIANAILDGTDAIMLSAETASGRYPIESVETMARIALYTEQHYTFHPPARITGGGGSLVARSLARVASTVAEELDCRLIVAFTESGSTARLVSSFRPRSPVAAVTYNPDTFRRLALAWGVVPVLSQFSTTTDEMILQGERLLKERGLVREGDTVLMLGGQSHTAGATNMLRVHTIS